MRMSTWGISGNFCTGGIWHNLTLEIYSYRQWYGSWSSCTGGIMQADPWYRLPSTHNAMIATTAVRVELLG